jgi:hypothetical protein
MLLVTPRYVLLSPADQLYLLFRVDSSDDSRVLGGLLPAWRKAVATTSGAILVTVVLNGDRQFLEEGDGISEGDVDGESRDSENLRNLHDDRS